MYFIFLNVGYGNILRCRFTSFSKHKLRKYIPKQLLIINQIIDLKTNYSTMEELKFFNGNVDRFHGVTVDSAVENCKIEHFPTILQESLKRWEESKNRGIWFKVALQHSDWVPILVKNGFDYHHAKNGFVMMYKWLPKEISRIPPYAHTLVGVGTVVINTKSEILVVREKYGLGMWKLPGGYVEPGENLIDAAIREVYEETKIDTEFCSILSLRQTHNFMFDCSDIYIIVCLKPLSTAITKCDHEIQDCTWMDIQDYLNHSEIHELNKFFVKGYLDCQNNGITIDCKHGIHEIVKRPYTVYYPILKKT